MDKSTISARPRITAFGASSIGREDPLYADVFALGRKLAEHGWDGSTGGHQGLMAAFAEGIHAGGGHIRGVTLSRFPTPPENVLSEEIRAYDFFDRMRSLIEEADAWIVLPGGLGTLSEFAMCWDMVCIGVLEPRPLLVYGEMWRNILPTLRRELRFSSSDPQALVRPCGDQETVLQILQDIRQ